MKPKEIVLEAFRLRESERTPVALMGGGAWTVFNSGNTFSAIIKSPEKMANMIISVQQKLKSDIVYCGSGCNNFHLAALGGKIIFRPVGPPELSAPIVKKREDLDSLDILDLQKDKAVNTIYDATKIVAKKISDEYLVTATSWGPLTLGAQIIGLEVLMQDILKDPGFVKKVVKFSTKLLLEFYKPLVDDGIIETVSIADPVASGNLISKKHFEEFDLPYIKKVNTKFKKRGINVLLHICGDTTEKLDAIAKSNATCFSIDSKVDLKQAREVFKGKMCIAGNLDPRGILKGPPEDVKKASKECIKRGSNGGGYILMPGCDVPPLSPFKNVKAIIKAAHEYRIS